MALRHPHADEDDEDHQVTKNIIEDSFMDIYEGVPKDVLHEAILAQYVECKVTRYQALSLTWELKKHERWKHFHSHCLNHFKAQNNDGQHKLELWKKWCTMMGIDVCPEEKDFVWDVLHKETSALNDLQEHYKHAEKIGIARGVIRGSLLGDQAISMKDHSSDSEVSSGSDTGTPGGDPEVPYSSDPEISIDNDGYTKGWLIEWLLPLVCWPFLSINHELIEEGKVQRAEAEHPQDLAQYEYPALTITGAKSNYTHTTFTHPHSREAHAESSSTLAPSSIRELNVAGETCGIVPTHELFFQYLMFPQDYRSSLPDHGAAMWVGMIWLTNPQAHHKPWIPTPPSLLKVLHQWREISQLMPKESCSESKALIMERERQLWEADKTATNKIVSQLAQALVLLCKAFKNATHNLIGTAYTLTPTSSRSSAHTHDSYKLKVAQLLEGHNFLYMLDQPKIFGHQALLDLTIAALIPTSFHGFFYPLCDEIIGDLFALSSTALFSALQEYQSRQFIPVDFSQTQTGHTHDQIKQIVMNAVMKDYSCYNDLHTTLHSIVEANSATAV
ncbi:hypothetical protein J3A83DRAFT_4476441 [Scleroderma citrinum]